MKRGIIVIVGTIVATLVETLFKGDHFKATRFEVKDLRLNLSRSGDVAWYSCLLDD